MNFRQRALLESSPALVVAVLGFVIWWQHIQGAPFRSDLMLAIIGIVFVWMIWQLYQRIRIYKRVQIFDTPIRGKILYKCRFATGRAFVTGHWVKNSVKLIVSDEEVWISLSGVNALVAGDYQLMHRFGREDISSIDIGREFWRKAITITYVNHIGLPIGIQIVPWNPNKLLSALNHESSSRHSQQVNQG